MGNPQNDRNTLPCDPPEWCPNADNIEQQPQRLERHDNECSQRNGDNIGQRTVKPRLVKMKQRDWRQHEFDGNTRDQQTE